MKYLYFLQAAGAPTGPDMGVDHQQLSQRLLRVVQNNQCKTGVRSSLGLAWILVETIAKKFTRDAEAAGGSGDVTASLTQRLIDE